MNIKEYIASGIIESYVLGLLTETERREFESQSNLYPEIGEARKNFELLLEQKLLADAKQPPVHLYKDIEEKLSVPYTSERVDEEKRRVPVQKIGIWKWAAAASFLLFAGATIWALYLNNHYQSAQKNTSELQKNLAQTSAELQQMKEDENKMLDPGMKMAALKGTTQAPQAQAAVFWDTTGVSHDVYLMVNNLPEPPSDKQYQLWALLNGKPINLGVINMEVRDKRLLLKMQNVSSAQAFAITLEPMGGSQSPDMAALYAMGSL
ncbi:MAG: anti-sigma factor domain-containing protein [Flavisolibacter sp.]